MGIRRDPGNKMTQPIQPEKLFFKDGGSIPNNKLPLLLYRLVFSPETRPRLRDRRALYRQLLDCLPARERLSLPPFPQHDP